MRCSGGTNFGLPLSVVERTNSRMLFFAAPSFQDGSGSACWANPKAAENSNDNTTSVIRWHGLSIGISCSWRSSHQKRRLLGVHHAAEADVRHAGVGAAPVPGARAVAGAVTVAAQERPAALNPLRR